MLTGNIDLTEEQISGLKLLDQSEAYITGLFEGKKYYFFKWDRVYYYRYIKTLSPYESNVMIESYEEHDQKAHSKAYFLLYNGQIEKTEAKKIIEEYKLNGNKINLQNGHVYYYDDGWKTFDREPVSDFQVFVQLLINDSIEPDFKPILDGRNILDIHEIEQLKKVEKTQAFIRVEEEKWFKYLICWGDTIRIFYSPTLSSPKPTTLKKDIYSKRIVYQMVLSGLIIDTNAKELVQRAKKGDYKIPGYSFDPVKGWISRYVGDHPTDLDMIKNLITVRD